VFTLVQNIITNITSPRASLFTSTPHTPNIFLAVKRFLFFPDSIQAARILKYENLSVRKRPPLESINCLNYRSTPPV